MNEAVSESVQPERWQGVMLDAYERAKSKIAKGIPLPDLETDYPGTVADSYTAVEIDRIERDGRDLFRFRLNDSGFVGVQLPTNADTGPRRHRST